MIRMRFVFAFRYYRHGFYQFHLLPTSQMAALHKPNLGRIPYFAINEGVAKIGSLRATSSTRTPIVMVKVECG